MRLHRFYINKPIGTDTGKVTISDKHLLHQWRNVFRYNVLSELVLFDGGGFEYDAVIEKFGKEEAELSIKSNKRGIIPEKQIILYQSLIKKDKMEWVVEKATELGVSKVVPIISERSEKKGLNMERIKKIAIEASEQCGRADVPEVSQVANLNEALEKCENAVVFDASGKELNHKLRIMNHGKSDSLHNLYFIPNNSCLFIGPEGGWTEKEIERFKEAKAKIFSLGKLTLRAETAAIAALTISALPGLGG